MKVKELFEESISAEQQVIDWIRQYCPNNFSALMSGRAVPLWRATRLGSGVTVDGYTFSKVNERASPRQSQTGSNLIMNYVSEAHDWSAVPKRNTSSSCTPSPSDARDFEGDLCLVIPFDSVKTYASVSGDFNFIEPVKGNGSTVMELMGNIRQVMVRAHKLGSIKSIDPSENLKKLYKVAASPIFALPANNTYSLEEIEALSDAIEKTIYLIEELDSSEFRGAPIKDLKAACEDFEEELESRSLNEFLAEKITPKNMGVKLYTGYPSIKCPIQSEVWFNGQYIAITGDQVSNYPEKLMSSSFMRKFFQKI